MNPKAFSWTGMASPEIKGPKVSVEMRSNHSQKKYKQKVVDAGGQNNFTSEEVH
jgi:hypothetical protein